MLPKDTPTNGPNDKDAKSKARRRLQQGKNASRKMSYTIGDGCVAGKGQKSRRKWPTLVHSSTIWIDTTTYKEDGVSIDLGTLRVVVSLVQSRVSSIMPRRDYEGHSMRQMSPNTEQLTQRWKRFCFSWARPVKRRLRPLTWHEPLMSLFWWPGVIGRTLLRKKCNRKDPEKGPSYTGKSIWSSKMLERCDWCFWSTAIRKTDQDTTVTINQ